MDTTPEKYIARLSELLQKKEALLLDILALTHAQTVAISEEGLDNLHQLIDAKQSKIDAIDKLNEEFETYFQRLKSTMGIARLEELDATKLDSAASVGIRQIKELTAGILQIIQSIRDIEEGNSQKSETLLAEYGNQIKKINQGKKTNNAYAPGTTGAPSYFLDKKK